MNQARPSIDIDAYFKRIGGFMTKADLVEEVSKVTELTRKDSEVIVDTLFESVIKALKTGDKVITNGGLRGTIISIKDDAVQLRVPPDNLRLEVARSSIASVAKQDEAA